MRVHDVRLPRAPDATCELDVTPLAAVPVIEHGQVDVVPALAERVLHLRDEDAEVGVLRPRVHLRDEQDAHYATRAKASPTRTAPGCSTVAYTPKSIAPSLSRWPR